MVSKSGDSQCSYSTDGFSHYRPVRSPSESQVATLCVTYTGSKGTISRCSHNGLESHSCICVSSVPSYTSCDQQSTVIPVQNRTDSASMAQQTLVSRTPLSVGVTTDISSSNTKPACSAKRKVITSKSERPATSRLGIVKQSIRDKQFSSEVAEHISQARRESTRKVSDAKWQIFRDWTNQRKIDYIQASPQIVADFLTFLFTVKKCQVSTIKGYRSTISNTLKYRSGYDIGTHPVLSELIKSFQKQRPVQRTLAPKWDLARTKSWTGFHVESSWTVTGVRVEFDFQAECQQDMKKDRNSMWKKTKKSTWKLLKSPGRNPGKNTADLLA